MANNPIPATIAAFIRQHHVVSLACSYQQSIWAASCFYAFDECRQRLIILTHHTTKHGTMMLHQPHLAGTIAAQPLALQDIEGIQFQATAKRLEDPAQQAVAFDCYFAKHPQAKGMQSDIWALEFTYIKHTENRTAFAHKSEWHNT